jgi:hypothetical protein
MLSVAFGWKRVSSRHNKWCKVAEHQFDDSSQVAETSKADNVASEEKVVAKSPRGLASPEPSNLNFRPSLQQNNGKSESKSAAVTMPLTQSVEVFPETSTLFAFSLFAASLDRHIIHSLTSTH